MTHQVASDTSESGPLSGAQRQYLRGLAHSKKPVVQVGQQGPTAAVFDAVRVALRDHELIKVRLKRPADKVACSEALRAASDSTLCGLVGHTVILYRAHPDKPRIKVPAKLAPKVAKPTPSAEAQDGPAPAAASTLASAI